MSQRLPIHPRIIDPSTGEPLLALKLVGNLPIWPIIGGDDGSEGGEGGDNSSGDDTTKTEETSTEGEDGTEGETTEGDTVSKADFDRLMARMQAADRRASAAETKVKDFEKAGQTDLEKATSEAQEAARERDETREALKAERIANAFLASNDVAWHDASDALEMLRSKYMDGVEIDDSGKVTGMKEAIKRLAKEKKYLVNAGGSGETSGDQMNGKRKGDKGDTAAKEKELAKRFPALARRQPQ